MNRTDSPLPLVSVLVPSYNAEAYQRECVESALAQSHANIEIIVVDDGSTDGSLQLARSFESRGVRVIAQDNRGQAGALNTAFNASKGEYIQYLDADDVLDAQKIAIQVARLQQAEPTAMASGAWARFALKPSEAVFKPEKVWQDLTPVDWLVESWAGGGMMHVAAWLIPRPVVMAAGPWAESLRWAANIDGDFFTRALLASTHCLFCPEARSYYRSVTGSQSSLSSRRSVEGNFSVLMRTGSNLLEKEDSRRTRKAFADNLQRFVFSTYPESPDLVMTAERRIRELGGSDLPLSAGPMQLALSRLVGWKFGKRLHRLAHKIRDRDK